MSPSSSYPEDLVVQPLFGCRDISWPAIGESLEMLERLSELSALLMVLDRIRDGRCELVVARSLAHKREVSQPAGLAQITLATLGCEALLGPALPVKVDEAGSGYTGER
jgi:hypothetical protein